MVSRPRRTKKPEQKRLLLVVDMLNGFLDPEGTLYCGRGARRIIPFVAEKVKTYRRNGRPVIFLADSHKPNDREFQMFPPHCVAGTWEARIIPELEVKDSAIVRKRRYSCFYGTNLARRLGAIKPDLVEVVGVCTNICVLYTVADLRNRDYRVRVPARGVASFDRKAHLFALDQMRSVLGAEVS